MKFKNLKTWQVWIIIVLLNSIAGWFWGLMMDKSMEWILGIILGLLIWYVILLSFDTTILKRKKYTLSKRIREAAVIKAFFQVVIPIDIWTAMFVFMILEVVSTSAINLDGQWVSSASITFSMGLFYSLYIILIYGFMSLIRTLRKKKS